MIFIAKELKCKALALRLYRSTSNFLGYSTVASLSHIIEIPSDKVHSMDETRRLNKLMSERQICSRREAEKYIINGLVRVNGKVVDMLGEKVPVDSRIDLDKKAIHDIRNKITVVLNKPLGYVSSQPEGNKIPAVRLLSYDNEFIDDKHPITRRRRCFEPKILHKMAVCGRLDVNSSGLMIFTQDGVLAKTIIGENSRVEKEYLVRVSKKLTTSQSYEAVEELKRGNFYLDGQIIKPMQVDILNDDQLRFVLNEGKKRQIRRLCEEVGFEVNALKRVRIGGVKLGSLPPGQWRYLYPHEKL